MKSKHKTLKFISLLLALPGLLASANASTIINGSFENPPITVGSYVIYGAGSTDITGWTVVGVNNALIESTVADRGIIFNAQSGNQWLDLTGPGPNFRENGISQDIATIIGQAYQISFYVGSATDNDAYFASTIDLSIDGGPRTGFTNNTAPTDQVDWKLFSSTFTATGNTTNITFFNGGAPENHIAGLDNVSIATIPEPSSFMILFSGGLIALSFSRKRRVLA